MNFGDFDQDELHKYMSEHMEHAGVFHPSVLVLPVMGVRMVARMAYTAGVRHERERQEKEKK